MTDAKQQPADEGKRGRGTGEDRSSTSGDGRRDATGRGGWKRDLLLVSIVLLVALVIRGIYIAQQHSDPLFDRPTVDAEYWHAWASAFAAGEGFEEGPYYRAPLYAWMLGAVYKTIGSEPFAWRVVQAMLGALTCALVYGIGRLKFNRGIGFVAGLITAVYWILVFFTGEMLIPTLATFLATLLVLLLLLADRRRTVAWWGAAGIVLGLSAITRPNILLVAPVIVLWMLVSRQEWRRFLAHAAVITLGCLLVVLPITVRNAAIGGDQVLISSQGGVNLYIGNNPQADGFSVVMPGTTAHALQTRLEQRAIAEQEAGRELSPSEISRFYARKTWDFVRSHPGAAAQLLFTKFTYFWASHEFANNKDIYAYTQRHTPLVTVLPLRFGLIAPLGLLGVAVIWPRRRELFPLWGFILVYMISIVLFFASARFRVPILPVLILLAVVAVEWMVRAALKKEWRSVLEAVAGLAFLLFFSNSGGWNAATGRWDAEPDWIDLRVAATFAQDGRTGEALEVYRDIIERNPDNYDALADSAFLYLARDELREAEANARRAVKIDRNDYKGYNALGTALLRQGRLDEALPHLSKAARLMPMSSMSQHELGRGLFLKGDFERARDHLVRALGLAPGHPKYLASLGLLAAEEDKVAEAVECFEKSVAAEPANRDVYLAWARMWERNGRITEAVSAARQGLEHLPGDDELSAYLAQLHSSAPGATNKETGDEP